jgi:sugar phosphate isomerase/epimerase
MAKIGVIHYNWPNFSTDDFLAYAAKIGCTHVELMCYDVWPDVALDGSASELEAAAMRTRRQVEAHGLKVSAFGGNNDFVQESDAAIEEQVERMRRVCIITRALGDDAVVRSEGGAPKEALAPDAQWESMYQCFTRCVPFLDELGVSLAVDNHGVITNDGDKLYNLLERINHPRIGSNLDTMNFRWFGNSLEDCNRFYDKLAPRVLHAHLKDGFGAREEYKGAALGEGEIDLQHALKALKAAGFGGVYTAEYEGTELDGTGYRKCVDWLKQNA